MSRSVDTIKGEGDFRVHSIEEPAEEPDSFMAYVPIAEDETSPMGDIELQGPVFEAEVVRASQSAGAIPRGRSIRYSVFAEPQIRPTGDMDVFLAGPHGETTELRVSQEDHQFVADDAAFLVEPELLGRTGWQAFRGAPIEFVPDPAQDPWRADVWLPVARIHRPAHSGCTAVYTTLDTDVDTYDAGFVIAGLGAKGKLEFTVTFKRTYPAEASCKEACVHAKAEIAFGTTYVGNKPFVYGTRVRISDIDPDRRAYRDIAPAFDQCGWSEAKAPPAGRTVEHLSGATGGKGDAPDDELTIGKQVAGTMSVGVEFAGSPVSLSVGYARTCAHTTALRTQFMPGADYLGYHPRIDNLLEKCWTVL